MKKIPTLYLREEVSRKRALATREVNRRAEAGEVDPGWDALFDALCEAVDALVRAEEALAGASREPAP